MITYVNTVFVSNNGTVATSLSGITKGQIVFYDIDNNAYTLTNDTARFKVGMATGKTNKQINPKTGVSTNVPDIRWSNIINIADIKGYVAHTNAGDTQDKVYIDFNSLDSNLLSKFAEGGKRIIVRLTFKDLPTRFRKWTESYEYVTVEGDTKASIAKNIVNMINKEFKRARVIAKQGTITKSNDAVSSFSESATGTGIELTAMLYDDDDVVDSLNWANTVRFNGNVYYTDPAADGWESTNKHFPKGVAIDKVPGKIDQASVKLVRDREAQAMGYLGILNRGEGTWPIIKPGMETDLSKTYNVVTLEFENMYRAADDIFRKTKQAVEIYTTGATSNITNVLDALTAAPATTESNNEGE